MFEAIEKQSLSDGVFAQLRERIVSRSLNAGDELPSERVLCELLKVNRGAVREAIKRLQQAGLVQVRHGGATTVLDYRAEAGLELLPSLLVNDRGEIQIDTARAIVRLRQILTPEVARDAALNPPPSLPAALDALLDSMRHNSDIAQRQFAVFEFWELLVDASGNIAYQLALNSLRKAYLPIWSLLTDMLADDFQDLATFEALSEAVKQSEAERAFTLAKQHIDHSSALINQFLDHYALSQPGDSAQETQ